MWPPPVTPPVTQSRVADYDIESTSYKFEEVLAKLEAYTRDELHLLAASLARGILNSDAIEAPSDAALWDYRWLLSLALRHQLTGLQGKRKCFTAILTCSVYYSVN